MALQFTGNRNAKMASVVAIDWDNVVDKPNVLLYEAQALTDGERQQARENIAAQRANVVDVRDFGASGNGLTDDSAAFVNAEAVGSLIFVAKGDYLLSTPVTTTDAAWLIDPTIPGKIDNLDMSRGFYNDQGNGANIWRFADRVFVGEAVTYGGDLVGNPGGTQCAPYFPTSVGANGGAGWGMIEAQLLSISQNGAIAVSGFSRASSDPVGSHASIAMAGFAIADKAGQSAWAMYADLQYQVDYIGFGLEIAVKNASGVDRNPNPYAMSNGAYGLWLQSGIDASYGPTATDPSAAAIGVVANPNSNMPWNKGIVFRENSLTDFSGSFTAMEMPQNYRIAWSSSAGVTGMYIQSSVSTTGQNVGLVGGNNTFQFFGAGGVRIVDMLHTASAVNFIRMSNATTGNSPSLSFQGTDTNGNLTLAGKGSGGVVAAFTNSGLSIKDSDASHALTITPSANLTANRIFTLATGDNARTLDISAANVTVSSFGASLVDDTSAATARATLDVVPNRAYAEYASNSDITTVIPADDTIPQNTEGVAILSATITPKSATNRLRIRYRGYGCLSASGESVAALFQDSTANALSATCVVHSGAGFDAQQIIEYEMVAGTTSATTFAIRVGPSGAVTLRMNGTTAGRIFGGVSQCTLVVEEVYLT